MPDKKPRKELILALGGGLLLVVLYFVMGRGGVGGGELFPVDYEEGLDISLAERVFDLDGVQVAVRVEPSPPKPMQEATYQIRFTKDGSALVVESLELAFNMKMDMGRLVYAPERSGEGYALRAALPTCRSGGVRWYGRLRFVHEGQPREKVFIVDLKKN